MAITYDPIATQTLGSGQGTITFSSIPATYTDLVLVANYGTAASGVSSFIAFNGTGGTSYSNTYLVGTGSATSGRNTSTSAIRIADFVANASGQKMFIVNIMNYANTTTYKTIISRASMVTTGDVGASVGLWQSTAAINSIALTNGASSNFNTGSVFTLYGIKAA